jgi:hypothetical protein
VCGERLIELMGDLAELPETRPRDGGEVVVFVVQTHVVGEEVEDAVVGVSFRGGDGRGRGLRGCIMVLKNILRGIVSSCGDMGWKEERTCSEMKWPAVG